MRFEITLNILWISFHIQCIQKVYSMYIQSPEKAGAGESLGRESCNVNILIKCTNPRVRRDRACPVSRRRQGMPCLYEREGLYIDSSIWAICAFFSIRGQYLRFGNPCETKGQSDDR
jgi:hypothetical protein